MCTDLVTFSYDRVTMYPGTPGATGNHVTGRDYEQVRGMSSMPAKKRPVVEYREMAPQHSDSKPSTCATGSRQFAVSQPAGLRFSNDGCYYDSGRRGSDDGWTGTGRVSFFDNSERKSDADRNLSDLLANKEKVIADILASGDTNEDKERKLADIIVDLETVRRRLAEQKAITLKVSPVNDYTG